MHNFVFERSFSLWITQKSKSLISKTCLLLNYCLISAEMFKRLNGSRLGKDGHTIPVNITETNKSMSLPNRLPARSLMAKFHNILSIQNSLSDFLNISGFKTSDYILTKESYA